jgi:hypothetical protein
MIGNISNQCIESIWGDDNSHWIIESGVGSYSICRTRASPGEGRDRGCGDNDSTDQMTTEISHQSVDSIWGNREPNRNIKSRVGSDSICRTRGSCHPSQRRDRGCGENDFADQMRNPFTDQSIDSSRIIESRVSSYSIC